MIIVHTMLSEAKMWELIKIIIPKVEAEWEDLAYCMRYKPENVEAIKRESSNLKEQCRKLFVDWLSSSNGPMPKTYLTLLSHIKKIKTFATTSKVIEKELIESK